MLANIVRNATKTATGDPYFSSVSLLLHMDGANGSTTFTDSGPNALAVTAAGSAAISTAQSKFGGASGYFNGSSGTLLSASSSVLDVSSGDFTIEFWFYASSVSSTKMLYELGTGASGDLQILIYSGTVSFGVGGGGATVSQSVSANTWHHICCVKSGSGLFFYLNGIKSSSTTQTVNSKTNAYIGGRSGGSLLFTGYIDDFRVTKGVARQTGSSITVPTAPYPNA
jgi:hypothetical protein